MKLTVTHVVNCCCPPSAISFIKISLPEPMNNHNIALMIREKIKLAAEPHFLALFKEKKLQVKLCGLFAKQ